MLAGIISIMESKLTATSMASSGRSSTWCGPIHRTSKSTQQSTDLASSRVALKSSENILLYPKRCSKPIWKIEEVGMSRMTQRVAGSLPLTSAAKPPHPAPTSMTVAFRPSSRTLWSRRKSRYNPNLYELYGKIRPDSFFSAYGMLHTSAGKKRSRLLTCLLVFVKCSFKLVSHAD